MKILSKLEEGNFTINKQIKWHAHVCKLWTKRYSWISIGEDKSIVLPSDVKNNIEAIMVKFQFSPEDTITEDILKVIKSNILSMTVYVAKKFVTSRKHCLGTFEIHLFKFRIITDSDKEDKIKYSSNGFVTELYVYVPNVFISR